MSEAPPPAPPAPGSTTATVDLSKIPNGAWTSDVKLGVAGTCPPDTFQALMAIYFTQLTQGCANAFAPKKGVKTCGNTDWCASASGQALSPTDAAAKSISVAAVGDARGMCLIWQPPPQPLNVPRVLELLGVSPDLAPGATSARPEPSDSSGQPPVPPPPVAATPSNSKSRSPSSPPPPPVKSSSASASLSSVSSPSSSSTLSSAIEPSSSSLPPPSTPVPPSSAGPSEELLTMIQGVWSSRARLGLSCLRDGPATSATATDSGLNWAQVHSVYDALSSKGGDLVKETLLKALEALARDRGSGDGREVALTKLRWIVIALNAPVLSDTDAMAVFNELCPAIDVVASSTETRTVLVQWLAADAEHLPRTIVAIQSFMAFRLFSGLAQFGAGTRPAVFDSIIESAVRTLDLVRRAALLAGIASPTGSEFVSDAITENFLPVSEETKDTIPMEYERWLEAGNGRGDDRARAAAATIAVPAPAVSESAFSYFDFPWVLSPEVKNYILRFESAVSQNHNMRSGLLEMLLSGRVPYYIIKVHRENLIQDTLGQLSTADEMRRPLKVKFIGEEGVDEGGVQKEFFLLVVRELFDAKYGMFVVDDRSREYYFNPASFESSSQFQLIGIILGLAIYNSVILEVRFPAFVWKWLVTGASPTLEDLTEVFPALGSGLKSLLEFDGDVETVFARNFEASYEAFGAEKVVELIPGGSKIPVTNANRAQYVEAFVKWKMVDSVSESLEAFARGFRMLTATPAFSLFTAAEVELLVCGETEFDLEDLERATRYEDGFTKDSQTIRDFWRVIHALPMDKKKAFLQFATGSDRVPIGGLSKLPFVISCNGSDKDRLPSSHTCFNHLLLSDYKDEALLREKLLKAIENTEGFGLI